MSTVQALVHKAITSTTKVITTRKDTQGCFIELIDQEYEMLLSAAGGSFGTFIPFSHRRGDPERLAGPEARS